MANKHQVQRLFNHLNSVLTSSHKQQGPPALHVLGIPRSFQSRGLYFTCFFNIRDNDASIAPRASLQRALYVYLNRWNTFFTPLYL